jgi:3-deoxy-manno-octulosonate cytidylyltransferase (CMP-KDO synthetase)
MIEHVYQRALEADASEVIVATDDTRIVEVVESFGGLAMMTSKAHGSGTDRVAEIAEQMDWPEDAIVVNLQGDEPMMEPALIKTAAKDLAQHPGAGIATLATPLTSREDVFDPNVVKVVMNHEGMALYFSRAPIPWVREDFSSSPQFSQGLPANVPFHCHLGLYAYRAGVLRAFPSLGPCALEQAEALEQNRALYHGIQIHLSIRSTVQGHGVDTEDDLRRVEALLVSTK